jgi:hypothetical protein
MSAMITATTPNTTANIRATNLPSPVIAHMMANSPAAAKRNSSVTLMATIGEFRHQRRDVFGLVVLMLGVILYKDSVAFPIGHRHAVNPVKCPKRSIPESPRSECVAVATEATSPELIAAFPDDESASALGAAERHFTAAAQNFGCSEIVARTFISDVMRSLRTRVEAHDVASFGDSLARFFSSANSP